MKRLLVVLLLFGIAFAVDGSPISANYDDADFDTDFYFSTTEVFSSDMSCRVTDCEFSSDPDDCIINGNPCDGVANVCPGTTLEITPEPGGRWAVGGSLDVFIAYPGCPVVGYCPEMEDYSSKTQITCRS